MSKTVSQKIGKVIKIDEDQIQNYLGELVRGTVEETLKHRRSKNPRHSYLLYTQFPLSVRFSDP